MNRARQKVALAVAGAVALALVAAGAGGTAPTSPSGGQRVVFLSSQLNTVPESEAMRRVILAGYRGDVEFVNTTADNVSARMRAEAQAGRGSVGLVGDVDVNFTFYRDALSDVGPVARQLRSARIPNRLLRLGRIGTQRQLMIPWMQATYVMAANRSALRYLPRGARITNLTYAQLLQWARNLRQRTGRNRFGFPVGPTGLMLRFLHGFLLPSYTGGVLTTWSSARAVQGWQYVRNLWQYSHPQSLQYNNMSEPLLSGEVLLAWDHVARLRDALQRRPGNFITFPVPRGPRGRAYLPVVAGVAIPRTAPNRAASIALVRYLLSLNAQARTLSAVGFFPVRGGRLSQRLGPGLLQMVSTVRRQQAAKNLIVSGLPIGLGTQSANFTRVMIETFTRIAVRGENIRSVLADQRGALQAVMDAVSAPCFKPDPPSRGTCRVG
jgi:multiple sugar transport system substrate-binding protein